MIRAETIPCNSCKRLFMVRVKDRKLTCPRCGQKMIKFFPIMYCDCSHRNTDHIGFDEYGDTGYCTKCRCPKFENVKSTSRDFVDP